MPKQVLKIDRFDGGLNNNANETDSILRITKDNQATELMRVQENGNVGIGTTGPSNNLHVYSSGADTILKIENDHASADALLLIDSSNNRDSYIRWLENGTTKWQLYNDGSDSDKLNLAIALSRASYAAF